MSDLDKKDFLDALNNYYKLKATYESSFNKEKTNIINNTALSWKEKRIEYKNYKPKCINCKRPVGTLFTRNYNDKDFSPVLKAICGDLQDPCSLNITLNIGYFEKISTIIKIDEKDIDDLKLSVIKDKNNLLFNYITTEQALENFDKLKSEIISIASSLETTNELWMNIIDNTEKKNTIKKKQEESYIIINEIKRIINEFSHTNNNSLIQDAVSMYVNQLVPLLKQLMNLKYQVNHVEYMEDENVYRLIQKEFNIQNLEFNYGSLDIISYNIGIKDTIVNKKATPILNEKITMNIGNQTNIENNTNENVSQDSDELFFNQEGNLNVL